MTNLIKLHTPELPEVWNYEDSVTKVKQMVFKWRTLTEDMAVELFIARDRLALIGGDRKSDQWNKSSTDKTWTKYCRDIGATRQVVDRWLKDWFIGTERERLIEEGKEVTPPKEVRIIHGDFIDSNVARNSVDLILTDPPYPGEFLHLWSELADFAVKVLKPSGFLVAYSGQYHLPDVLFRLNEFEELSYYWTFCLYHEGLSQIVNARNLMCRWKPIVVYQKLPEKKLENTFPDYIVSEKTEKFGHEWQQSESGAATLVEYFTKEGDTICDPFCGSGTFPYVANKLKRSVIGIDIDEDCVNISKGRFK